MLRLLFIASVLVSGLAAARGKSKKNNKKLSPGYRCHVCETTMRRRFATYELLDAAQRADEAQVQEVHELICTAQTFLPRDPGRSDDLHALVRQCERQADLHGLETRFDVAVLKQPDISLNDLLKHMCVETKLCARSKADIDEALLNENNERAAEQLKALIDDGMDLHSAVGVYHKVVNASEAGAARLRDLPVDTQVVLSFSIRNYKMKFVAGENELAFVPHAPEADVPVGMREAILALAAGDHHVFFMPPEKMWGAMSYNFQDGNVVGPHEHCFLEIIVHQILDDPTVLDSGGFETKTEF